ncbi:NrsF family protein [Caulobacter henricii]|uniref:RNA polymerase subunit sigma n=1 Tax=Caulobacter henricii TaxID=69395 RepID=A0A0P0P2E6_9CAUL|nr:NrsF family protein [Caulobacter henricii]ALL14576.1 hypothetical protein AQ619_15140 [Caulobacter henricii]
MRTDDLIDALAADAGPPPGAPPAGRFGLLAGLGALLALFGVLAWLKVRPDLMQVMHGSFFWLKAGYTGALGLAGFLAVERLARPTGSPRRGLLLGLIVLIAFGLAALVQAGLAEDPMTLMRGGSWTRCSLNILVLGAPTTLLGLWVLRGLAPTRALEAGFATGALAGGVAATVYGLHCAESTFVFVGLWYSLGVLGCAALGAVIGRWVLRW